MKRRRNIVVDDELLETARQVTGEKTYSGAVTKALEQITRQHRFREKLRAFQEEARKGGMFVPGYLEQIRPPEYSMDYVPPKRRSAHEVREPRRKKSRRRASR